MNDQLGLLDILRALAMRRPSYLDRGNGFVNPDLMPPAKPKSKEQLAQEAALAAQRKLSEDVRQKQADQFRLNAMRRQFEQLGDSETIWKLPILTNTNINPEG